MRDALRASIAARARGSASSTLGFAASMCARASPPIAAVSKPPSAPPSISSAPASPAAAPSRPASAKLEQLSPLKILARGYAIVSNEHGIVKDSSDAPIGSPIRVRLDKGALAARVEGRDS